MKRIAISLLAAALAVSLTACGGPKLSDSDLMDIAQQQVSYDREGLEVTAVKLVSSTEGKDNCSDVVVTVTSETDYVTYEDQYTLTLKYDVSAVNGLKEIALVSEGKTVKTELLEGARQRAVAFQVSPTKNTWYAVTVTDKEGLCAWTNPVFVRID